jgi:hypothetical protein
MTKAFALDPLFIEIWGSTFDRLVTAISSEDDGAQDAE